VLNGVASASKLSRLKEVAIDGDVEFNFRDWDKRKCVIKTIPPGVIDIIYR
jgi:hypothetical protein